MGVGVVEVNLPNAEPRSTCLAVHRQPLIIFTHGCCHPNEGSASGVDSGYGPIMFDPEDNAYEFVKKDMSEELKWFLSLEGRKAQIVGQAEVLPCLLAKRIWTARMRNRAVLYFIDNDAARYSFIKGISDDPHMSVMPTSFWDEERITPSFPWFARAPTVGNPADEPGRGGHPLRIVLQKLEAHTPCRKGNGPVL